MTVGGGVGGGGVRGGFPGLAHIPSGGRVVGGCLRWVCLSDLGSNQVLVLHLSISALGEFLIRNSFTLDVPKSNFPGKSDQAQMSHTRILDIMLKL